MLMFNSVEYLFFGCFLSTSLVRLSLEKPHNQQQDGYKWGPPIVSGPNAFRCGSKYKADCSRDQCCGNTGWCGDSDKHCNCDKCVDFRVTAPPEEKEYIPADGETCNLSPEDRRVKILASDFQGTVTSTDTTRLDVQSTVQFKYGSKGYREAILKYYADIQWRWRNEIEKVVRGKMRKSYTCRFNLGGIESLVSDVTLESWNWANRIAHRHIFDDIVDQRLRLAAKEIKFLPGVVEFVKKLKSHTESSFRILSLGFFDELVYAAFNGSVPKRDIFTGKPPVLNGATKKLIKSDLTTGFDKRKFLRQWRNEIKTKGKVIYVGNDITDLLALLEADIGFIMKGNERILQVARHFGVTVMPIKRLLHTQLDLSEETPECGKKKILFLADSWDQIEEFIFGTC